MRQSVLTMTGSLFFKTFFPFAPSLFAQSPVCVCGRREREKEQQQQQQSALALYTPCVLSMCVCCCLLWMANGARDQRASMCRDRWTRFLKGLLMLTLGAQSYVLPCCYSNQHLSTLSLLYTLPAIDHPPPPPLLLCERGKTIFKIKDDARRELAPVSTHTQQLAILTFLTVFRQASVLFQSRGCCLFCPLNFSFDTKRRAVPPPLLLDSSFLYKIDIIQHQFLKRNVITLE